MKTLFTILTAALLSMQAAGQVNIEKFRNPLDSSIVTGGTEVDGEMKTGNKDHQSIDFGGLISLKLLPSTILMVWNSEFGWTDGKQYSNDALLHMRYIYSFNKTIDAEIFGQIDYNKKRLLDFRGLGGAGVRFNFLTNDKMYLSYGTALMGEHEDLTPTEGIIHDDVKNVVRWSNYISGKISISDNAVLNVVLYAQPQIDKFNDYRLLTENSLVVFIGEGFAASIGFSARYDSIQPEPIKKLDAVTSVGLLYNF